MKLEGAGAIVTGGASGLGRAVVDMLAEAGAKPVVFDLNAEAASEAAEGCRRRGGRGRRGQ